MIQEILKEFVEKGAELEHTRWANWQKYLFSKCEVTPSDDLIIPKELVNRWWKQIETPYKKLSEKEKESDRKEVRTYLPLLEKSLKRVEEETLKGIPCQITSWCDQGYEHDGNCKGHATYTLKV